MGLFEGFYTGEEANADNGNFLGSDTFAKRRLKREKEQAKAALLDKWKAELKQCSSRKSLRNYIETYKSETENPYVRQAEDILDNLDFIWSEGSEYALTQYIENHPQGKHIDEAKKLIPQLKQAREERDKKRKEKIESIFTGIAFSIFIIVFLLTFFGTESSFWESGSIALSASAPVYIIYRTFFDN